MALRDGFDHRRVSHEEATLEELQRPGWAREKRSMHSERLNERLGDNPFNRQFNIDECALSIYRNS